MKDGYSTAAIGLLVLASCFRLSAANSGADSGIDDKETDSLFAGGLGILLICFSALISGCSVLFYYFKRHLRTHGQARQTSGARTINTANDTQNSSFSAAPSPHSTMQPMVQIQPSSTQLLNQTVPSIIQNESKEAQLSSGEAPPSYEAAVAYPSYMIQDYIQSHSVPCYSETYISTPPQSQPASSPSAPNAAQNIT